MQLHPVEVANAIVQALLEGLQRFAAGVLGARLGVFRHVTAFSGTSHLNKDAAISHARQRNNLELFRTVPARDS
jgi:hypothetical protein